MLTGRKQRLILQSWKFSMYHLDQYISGKVGFQNGSQSTTQHLKTCVKFTVEPSLLCFTGMGEGTRCWSPEVLSVNCEAAGKGSFLLCVSLDLCSWCLFCAVLWDSAEFSPRNLTPTCLHQPPAPTPSVLTHPCRLGWFAL